MNGRDETEREQITAEHAETRKEPKMAAQQAEPAKEGVQKGNEIPDDTDLRVEAAMRRTVLANERTFSAWLRTGVAAIGLGLAGPSLLAVGDARAVAIWMGVILILLGASVSILAASRYYRIAGHLETGTEDLTPPWMIITIVTGLTVVATLAVVLVLME